MQQQLSCLRWGPLAKCPSHAWVKRGERLRWEVFRVTSNNYTRAVKLQDKRGSNKQTPRMAVSTHAELTRLLQRSHANAFQAAAGAGSRGPSGSGPTRGLAAMNCQCHCQHSHLLCPSGANFYCKVLRRHRHLASCCSLIGLGFGTAAPEPASISLIVYALRGHEVIISMEFCDGGAAPRARWLHRPCTASLNGFHFSTRHIDPILGTCSTPHGGHWTQVKLHRCVGKPATLCLLRFHEC